jgi:acylphosphatase
MPACKRVHYWGTVQGVGFRMTTKRIASQFVVTGYVRNLADGQVEVVVAGEPDEIDRFLGAVAGRMAQYIQGHRIDDATEPSSAFTSFEIRM